MSDVLVRNELLGDEAAIGNWIHNLVEVYFNDDAITFEPFQEEMHSQESLDFNLWKLYEKLSTKEKQVFRNGVCYVLERLSVNEDKSEEWSFYIRLCFELDITFATYQFERRLSEVNLIAIFGEGNENTTLYMIGEYFLGFTTRDDNLQKILVRLAKVGAFPAPLFHAYLMRISEIDLDNWEIHWINNYSQLVACFDCHFDKLEQMKSAMAETLLESLGEERYMIGASNLSRHLAKRSSDLVLTIPKSENFGYLNFNWLMDSLGSRLYQFSSREDLELTSRQRVELM